MTRITMAALPIVEVIEGASGVCQFGRRCNVGKRRGLHIATTLPPTEFPKER